MVWMNGDCGRAYHNRIRRIAYPPAMHGTLPLSERQALESLRGDTAGRKSIAVLAREWGWSRDKVRRRLESWRISGELSVAQALPKRRTARQSADEMSADEALAPEAQAIEPLVIAAPAADSRPSMPAPAPDVEFAQAEAVAADAGPALDPALDPAPAPVIAPAAPSRAGRYGRGLAIALLAGVGVALAAIGMIETTAYASRVGGWLFAALAICADALVLLMPAALAVLWRRRSPAVIVAAALWLVGGAVTLANLSGYIGSSDDAFRAGRETQSTQRALALEQLARLRGERAAIVELRPVGAINAALNNARQSKRPALREALAVAQRRDALEVKLSAVSAGLPAVPQVALVDPSAGVLSEITGATVSETLLRRVRLALLLLLPLCGGFVLGVALSLFPTALPRDPALDSGA